MALAQAKACGNSLVRLENGDRGDGLAEATAALRRAERDPLDEKRAAVLTPAPKPAGPSLTCPVLKPLRRQPLGPPSTAPEWRQRRPLPGVGRIRGELAEAEHRWQAHVAPQAARLKPRLRAGKQSMSLSPAVSAKCPERVSWPNGPDHEACGRWALRRPGRLPGPARRHPEPGVSRQRQPSTEPYECRPNTLSRPLALAMTLGLTCSPGRAPADGDIM